MQLLLSCKSYKIYFLSLVLLLETIMFTGDVFLIDATEVMKETFWTISWELYLLNHWVEAMAVWHSTWGEKSRIDWCKFCKFLSRDSKGRLMIFLGSFIRKEFLEVCGGERRMSMRRELTSKVWATAAGEIFLKLIL